MSEAGDGDYTASIVWWIDFSIEFDTYVAQMQDMKSKEKEEEEYVPFEHLRTIKENSDFYTMDFKINLNKDILGKDE